MTGAPLTAVPLQGRPTSQGSDAAFVAEWNAQAVRPHAYSAPARRSWTVIRPSGFRSTCGTRPCPTSCSIRPGPRRFHPTSIRPTTALQPSWRVSNDRIYIVYMGPMTIAGPHAHNPETEEVWIKMTDGAALMQLGSEIRP